MGDELSLIKFNVINFFSIIINSRPFQPISTILIKIVDSLINAEPNPDEKTKERLKWIYKNTHEKVYENLSIVELSVFKNLDKGLNREIEINNKSLILTDLYKYLDEISLELTKIVIDIAKKYSLDVPMISFGQMDKVKISI